MVLEWSKMSPPTDMKGPIGDIHVAIWKELFRIATALERQCQAYPPIVPPTIDKKPSNGTVGDTESVPLRGREKVQSPPTSPKLAEEADVTHFEGSRKFYNFDCGRDCPMARSCIEYCPGDKCIGWKTRNYKGGK